MKVEVPLQAAPSQQEQKRGPDLSSSKTMSQLDSPPPFGSAWLPTFIETLLLSVYPATLLIGSLFSTLTIDHAQTPYVAHIQSYDPANAPSYFAKKSNIFNVYFVKVGWAWATLAIALFILGSRALGPVSYISAPQRTVTRKRLQAIARWGLLTAIWWSVTQDFFGVPLIDRGFTYTGGKCDLVLSEDIETLAREEEMSKAAAAASHAACRLIGGQWKGGHDISGHVFLLTLGSAMLWFEVLPIVLGWAGLTRARKMNGETREGVDSTEAKRIVTETQSAQHVVMFAVALVVAAANWWMLLMTAAYFHTWFEKLTGLLVALSAIYVTYFLPRAVPSLRKVLGAPGI